MTDFEYARTFKASWKYEVVATIPCTEKEREIYGVDYKKSEVRTYIHLQEIHVQDTNSSIYKFSSFYGVSFYGVSSDIDLYFSTFESAEKHIFKEFPDAKLTSNSKTPDNI